MPRPAGGASAPDSRAAVQCALNPRSVAVLGASDDLMKWGGSILALLRKFGFGGAVHPVNPRADAVQGIKAWPSVQAIGQPVDVAVIALPQERTEAAFEDCAAAGVKVILMVTSQFAESGAEGAALQDKLLAIARRAGMRIIGPNCMGYFNSHADMNLLNSQALMRNASLIKGEVALISQSGALAGAMLARAYDLGVGFSICVSLGNQADLEVCDFLDYAIDDARSKVIALYVEGVKDGARFVDLLRRARAAGKAVLIVKAGRTALGQQAVQSHTASLAGEFRAFESQVRHAGAVLVDDFLELVAQAAAWTRLPAPSGPQVAVLSGSGGGGAVSSDLVGEAGLQAATLGPATVRKLLPLMPEAAAHLPFDLGAVPGPMRSTPQWLRQVLDTMLADPGVGAGLFLMTTMPEMAATAATVVDVNRENPKPVAFVNAASSAGAEAGAKLKAEGLVNFASVKEALGYLRNRLAWEHHENEASAPDVKAQAAIEKIAGEFAPGLVSEFDTKRLLAAAGIPVTPGELVRSEDQAVHAAASIGWPVVMKLVSAQISHKSDVGGVVLNVGDADAVRQHFRALQQAVQRVPGASFDGCLVQQQARADVEVLIGTNWDAQFGAMLMIGIGGTLVELLKDTALLPANAGPRAIRRAIQALRLFPLLDGYRGKPRANLDALVDAARRFGQLAVQLGARLPECEANPVMIAGDSLVVADARAVWLPGAPSMS
ncbi:MAG: acetate--CoA ligase family protein [Proteobacteria bacterium]|nr:acetate--CoA ligase family protein [Burkholderiales bacterium]MCA0311325.1 acetate--CoA ligase family protein [Pseudomonadota bacterium]